ncbi:MAG: dehydrogenase/reductase protein [Actinomycetia bacterium]|nr:dehydrogenase/reductase protein [Actinomycetes bacterium]
MTTSSTNRIALITGGSRGIGRATALHLARAGVDSIITYRSNADDADHVLKSIADLGQSAVALPLDVGAVASFDEFTTTVSAVLSDTWGRPTFDFLVNNGGAQRPGSFADATEPDFDALVNEMFKGTFFLSQKLAPLLVDGGSIVNVSSGVTRFYTPHHFIYAACKGAVEVLTRYLAKELGPRQITVNTVAPGATATDFSGGLLRNTPEIQQMVTAVTALGRYGEADDIGSAIAALLGGGNHWITGQRIEVSGGQNL